MTDHLTRVAEAVRDACAETCNEQHTIAERRPIPATICAMHIGHIDLPAIIASVPRPEPVAAQVVVPGGLLTAADMKALRRFIECAEDCDAGGHDVPKEAMKRLERLGAVRSLGFGRHETTAFGDAMLAAAPEAPQVAVQDRRAEACLTAMDHISTETLESFNRVGIKFDATRGYAEELEAEIATLREQNAALVAALEGVLRWIDHWAQTGPGMDFERVEAAADAALACVKGGAV